MGERVPNNTGAGLSAQGQRHADRLDVREFLMAMTKALEPF
jgi:hypothetical protein